MKSFEVRWVIEIDGEDHEDAAVNAYNALTEKSFTAVFEMREIGTAKIHFIDAKAARAVSINTLQAEFVNEVHEAMDRKERRLRGMMGVQP